jgi:hypothetical protein
MITQVEIIYCNVKNTKDMYKMTRDGITSFVPLDTANTDYQAIQQWISEGNTVIDNPPE